MLQGDAADQQKLRTAALKLRLAQLTKERRAREVAEAAAFEARQRELDRHAAGRRVAAAGRVPQLHGTAHP